MSIFATIKSYIYPWCDDTTASAALLAAAAVLQLVGFLAIQRLSRVVE